MVKQPEHDRVIILPAALIRFDTIKTFISPFSACLCIYKQATRLHGAQPVCIIDPLLTRPSVDTLPGAELQLARRIIAGMAHHTPLFQYRFDLMCITHFIFWRDERIERFCDNLLAATGQEPNEQQDNE